MPARFCPAKTRRAGIGRLGCSIAPPIWIV
jgi:hypothetical protein